LVLDLDLVFVRLSMFSILCVKFLVWLRLFCSCVCSCYVRFSFFNTVLRDWLGRTFAKWPILCRVGRKTLTKSVNQSVVTYRLRFIIYLTNSW